MTRGKSAKRSSISRRLLPALLAVMMVVTMMPTLGYAYVQTTGTTYKVTFDAKGGTPEPAAQEVKKGELVEEPDDPKKTDAEFKGWFNNGKLYDFDKPVKSDLNLEAEWETGGSVIEKAEITAEDISFPDSVGVRSDGTYKFTYTGSPIRPEPVVKVDGKTLKRGTDYRVTYQITGNHITAGYTDKLKMTVKAKAGSNYKGSKITLYYTIVPKKVKPTVTLSKTSFAYNGKKKAPAMTVKVGKKILEKGTDYTVSYPDDRKNVGKHAVKVKLKGNYTGSRKAYYKIKPAGTKLKTVKGSSRKMTIKWKRQSAKMSKARISGYQIQYSPHKTFKSGKKLVTVKGYRRTSKTIRNLKDRQRYYVRIRTYKKINGTKYYSPWSDIKTARAK